MSKNIDLANDKLVLGGHEFTSRFILGSGKFSLDLVKACIEKADAQPVTRISGAVPKDTWYAKLMRWAVKWVSISTIRLSSLKC